MVSDEVTGKDWFVVGDAIAQVTEWLEKIVGIGVGKALWGSWEDFVKFEWPPEGW